MAKMTRNVQTIVAEYLKTHGYDGLYDGDDCGCEVDNLFPCGLECNPYPYCKPATGGKATTKRYVHHFKMFNTFYGSNYKTVVYYEHCESQETTDTWEEYKFGFVKDVELIRTDVIL